MNDLHRHMQGYLSGSLLTEDKLQPSGTLISKSLPGTRQSSSWTDDWPTGRRSIHSDLRDVGDELLNSDEVGVMVQVVAFLFHLRTSRLRYNIMTQMDLNRPQARGHRASLGRCRTGHA